MRVKKSLPTVATLLLFKAKPEKKRKHIVIFMSETFLGGFKHCAPLFKSIIGSPVIKDIGKLEN